MQPKWRLSPGRFLVLLCIAIGAAGCSSFNRDWRQAGRAPAPAHDISGRWEGRWTSEATGHSDKLRCLMTKVSDERYEARFHARFWKILSFGYTVLLEIEQADSVFHFKGEADLGRLAGGVYQYEGHASPEHFFSTYRSSRDHGDFEMSRPGEQPTK
jgi:hypothetical protein